jgi:hypothetical protein
VSSASNGCADVTIVGLISDADGAMGAGSCVATGLLAVATAGTGGFNLGIKGSCATSATGGGAFIKAASIV